MTEVARDKILPDPAKSLKRGAIAPLGPYKGTWLFRQVEAVLAAFGHHADTPFNEMEDEVLHTILNGRDEPLRVESQAGLSARSVQFEGIIPYLLEQAKEGAKEDHESWLCFLRHLKSRGLTGVRLAVSDKCLGLVEALAESYPEALWQRCAVHFYRNVFSVVPHNRLAEVAMMLKTIHAQEDRQAAEDKIKVIVAKLSDRKLHAAAKVVSEGAHETLSYYAFPQSHWRHLRTNNPLERIMKEIRRRTRVVGSFPDGESALMLVAARLRHISGTRWGTRLYMNMQRLCECDEMEALTTA